MKCKACRGKAEPCEARVFVKVGDTKIETITDGFKCLRCNQTFVEVAVRVEPITVTVRPMRTTSDEETIKFNA